jgi:hypothetical protein
MAILAQVARSLTGRHTGITMKTVILAVAVLSALFSFAQQSAHLPFQWHGQTMGIDFETSNLTSAVKAAIRDDIAYAMSLIPSPHVAFEALTPTSSGYGKYTGSITVSHTTPINYCDGVLCYYKSVDNAIVFQLAPSVCSEYSTAIARTHQFSAEMLSFSNFINQVKTGYHVADMTLDQKKALFWPPSIVAEWQTIMGANFEQDITDALPDSPAPTGTWNMPSILAYQTVDIPMENTNQPSLLCELKVYGAASGERKMRYIYANGAWRALIEK